MTTARTSATAEPVGTDLVRLLKALKLGALAGTLPERVALARNTNSATSVSSKYSSPTKSTAATPARRHCDRRKQASIRR